jgi:effector-binding domain-containing protein
VLGQTDSPIAVERRTTTSTVAAAIHDTVDLRDLPQWFAGALTEIDGAIAQTGQRATGLPGGTYEDALVTEMRGDIDVYIPVPGPPRAGRVQPKVISAAELVVTIHRGDYADLEITYVALGMWVVQHALTIAWPVRETYRIGPQDTIDKTEWITEIGWPLATADRP